MTTKRTTCRICGSPELFPFLNLGSTPLVDAFVEKENLDKPEEEFPLEVGVCMDCNLVSLMHVVDSELLFGNNYAFYSSGSPQGVIHFRNYAKKIMDRFPSLVQNIFDAKRASTPHIEVWGTGAATRDLIYIDDAVEGILLAAEKYDEEGALNVATGIGISIKDLVTLLCSIIEYKGEIQWDATKPEGAMARTVNIEKAKRTIGFVAKTKLEQGLRETIAWHIANP